MSQITCFDTNVPGLKDFRLNLLENGSSMEPKKLYRLKFGYSFVTIAEGKNGGLYLFTDKVERKSKGTMLSLDVDACIKYLSPLVKAKLIPREWLDAARIEAADAARRRRIYEQTKDLLRAAAGIIDFTPEQLKRIAQCHNRPSKAGELKGFVGPKEQRAVWDKYLADERQTHAARLAEAAKPIKPARKLKRQCSAPSIRISRGRVSVGGKGPLAGLLRDGLGLGV